LKNDLKNQNGREGTIILQITAAKITRTQIQVFWTDAEKYLSDLFPYEALMEMKINAFDLLESPKFTGLMETTTGLNLQYDDKGGSHHPVTPRKADWDRVSTVGQKQNGT